MDGEKNEKKQGDPIKKLETEFLAFQKEWKEFLANDFHHVAVNVDTLVKQNNIIQQNIGTIQQNMDAMQKNILKALGTRAYNWVGGKVPKKEE